MQLGTVLSTVCMAAEGENQGVGGFGAFAQPADENQSLSAFAALAADSINATDVSQLNSSRSKGFVPLDASMYAGGGMSSMAVGFEAPAAASGSREDEPDVSSGFSSFSAFGTTSAFGTSTIAQPEEAGAAVKRPRHDDGAGTEPDASPSGESKPIPSKTPVSAVLGPTESTGEDADTTVVEVRARLYAWVVDAGREDLNPPAATFGVASVTESAASAKAAASAADASSPSSKRQRIPDVDHVSESSGDATAAASAGDGASAEAANATRFPADGDGPSLPGEWVEMGTGPLRINAAADSGQRRLVMRQEGEAGGVGLRVLLNSWAGSDLRWEAGGDVGAGQHFARTLLSVAGRPEPVSCCLVRFRSRADLDAVTAAIKE